MILFKLELLRSHLTRSDHIELQLKPDHSYHYISRPLSEKTIQLFSLDADHNFEALLLDPKLQKQLELKSA